MDRLLGQHIIDLQNHVQQVSHEMMLNRKTRDERNLLEAELRVAEQALAHYKRAVKLEAELQRQAAAPSAAL